MTKHELIAELASRSGLSESKAAYALSCLTDIICDEVSTGRKVTISGFGTFDRGQRQARHGIDPQTGIGIEIPEMVLPRFRAGVTFKARVRSV